MSDKELLLKLADEIEVLPLPRLTSPASLDVRAAAAKMEEAGHE